MTMNTRYKAAGPPNSKKRLSIQPGASDWTTARRHRHSSRQGNRLTDIMQLKAMTPTAVKMVIAMETVVVEVAVQTVVEMVVVVVVVVVWRACVRVCVRACVRVRVRVCVCIRAT